MEKKAINLVDGTFVPFIDYSPEYGLAEFQICPQFKRGKLVRLSMYPKQMEDRSYHLVWEGQPKDYFRTVGYEGLHQPESWMFNWCKEHKCQSFSMCVPRGAKFIWFSEMENNVIIGFTKNRW